MAVVIETIKNSFLDFYNPVMLNFGVRVQHSGIEVNVVKLQVMLRKSARNDRSVNNWKLQPILMNREEKVEKWC